MIGVCSGWIKNLHPKNLGVVDEHQAPAAADPWVVWVNVIGSRRSIRPARSDTNCRHCPGPGGVSIARGHDRALGGDQRVQLAGKVQVDRGDVVAVEAQR